MSISKAEILSAIDSDISDYESKLNSLMATGSMSTSKDELMIASFTRTLCLLNETKTYVTDNL
jgi:hypothetical protein